MLLLLSVVSILGSQSGFSVGGARLLKEVSISLDIYILLVPYFTFVPMELLLRSLLQPKDPKKM